MAQHLKFNPKDKTKLTLVQYKPILTKRNPCQAQGRAQTTSVIYVIKLVTKIAMK